jgi:hypothetical protein
MPPLLLRERRPKVRRIKEPVTVGFAPVEPEEDSPINMDKFFELKEMTKPKPPPPLVEGGPDPVIETLRTRLQEIKAVTTEEMADFGPGPAPAAPPTVPSLARLKALRGALHTLEPGIPDGMLESPPDWFVSDFAHWKGDVRSSIPDGREDLQKTFDREGPSAGKLDTLMRHPLRREFDQRKRNMDAIISTLSAEQAL